MVRTHRLATIALLVSFVAPLQGTLIASEQQQLAAVVADAASPSRASLVEPYRLPLGDDIFHTQAAAPTGANRWRGMPTWFENDGFEEQRGRYRGGRGRSGRHDGARAAIALGAIAAVAGTAVLVYANRPECKTNPADSGCGYGTKVVGGAVLTGGVAAVLVGALTWR